MHESWISLWTSKNCACSLAYCRLIESFKMKANTTRKMASILNVTDSAYYPAFKYPSIKLFHLNNLLQVNVPECGGSSKWSSWHYCASTSPTRAFSGSLKNLKHSLALCYAKGLETADFADIRPLFPPLMHIICLVYANSKYYNSTARIIVLMQVIEKLA